jgi:hypothetical protein
VPAMQCNPSLLASSLQRVNYFTHSVGSLLDSGPTLVGWRKEKAVWNLENLAARPSMYSSAYARVQVISKLDFVLSLYIYKYILLEFGTKY